MKAPPYLHLRLKRELRNGKVSTLIIFALVIHVLRAKIKTVTHILKYNSLKSPRIMQEGARNQQTLNTRSIEAEPT